MKSEEKRRDVTEITEQEALEMWRKGIEEDGMFMSCVQVVAGLIFIGLLFWGFYRLMNPDGVFQITNSVIATICLVFIWYLIGNIIHFTILGMFGFNIEMIGILALFVLSPFIPALWLVGAACVIFSGFIYDTVRCMMFFKKMDYDTFESEEQHFCTKLMYFEGIKKALEDIDNKQFFQENHVATRWLEHSIKQHYDAINDYVHEEMDWDGIKQDTKGKKNKFKRDFMNEVFKLAQVQIRKTVSKSDEAVGKAIVIFIVYQLATSFIGYVMTEGYTTTADTGIAYYCEKPED